MPKINPRIKSIDDLLGLDAAEESPIEPTPSVSLPTKNTIITLPPQAIRAFRGHPFRLYEGDRLNDLVESISEHGVLNPAIIRKIERDEDGFEYEMLAGHNRQNAAAIANRELPCIVKENLSDEDAWIYVIETNVLQRSFSEMLPSEKAAVLALRYSKMVCQGRRNDIIKELKRLENPDEIKGNRTGGSDFHRIKSRDALGAEYDLTGRSVATYLRINELSDALKIRIDNGEFSIAAAVQLSYLTEQEQQMVDDVLSGSEYKVNEGKVVLLREYTGKLTPERTEQILSGEFNRKPKKSTATAFKVKPAIYKKYFTVSISQKEFDSIVDEALALYFAQKEQESEQEAGYFPEFGYGTYWRLLERLTSGTTARFQFAKNIYSTYNQRVHFSPVWFPDGSYTVNTHVMDIWTPAGMLAMNLTDDVTISGSLYDDWHIAPGNP